MQCNGIEVFDIVLDFTLLHRAACNLLCPVHLCFFQHKQQVVLIENGYKTFNNLFATTNVVYITLGQRNRNGMFKKILNLHEEATSQRLAEVCNRYDASAYPKVRVADVLPIENSGISSAEYSYAMKAHFDFIVCNQNHIPQFAVEFDGPSHLTPEQIERDQKKNHLCEVFHFPLLRVNSNHLPKRFKEYDLLSWFVEHWFLAIEFEKAQEEGHVPWDEPYDPMMFINLPGKKSKFPMWLSSDVRIKVQQLQKKGKLASPFISEWLGVDSKGNYHGIAWVKTSEGLGIAAETAMKKQLFPVAESDLLTEILCFHIMDGVEEFISGKRQPEDYASIMRRVKEYAGKYEERGFGGYCHENPNEKP